MQGFPSLAFICRSGGERGSWLRPVRAPGCPEEVPDGAEEQGRRAGQVPGRAEEAAQEEPGQQEPAEVLGQGAAGRPWTPATDTRRARGATPSAQGPAHSAQLAGVGPLEGIGQSQGPLLTDFGGECPMSWSWQGGWCGPAVPLPSLAASVGPWEALHRKNRGPNGLCPPCPLRSSLWAHSRSAAPLCETDGAGGRGRGQPWCPVTQHLVRSQTSCAEWGP